MINNKQQIGALPFKGKQVEIWVNPSQWRSFYFDGNKFWISKNLAQNNHKLNQSYQNYCNQELKNILQNTVNNLKHKKIVTNLPYSNGVKHIYKQTSLSINEYLKLTGYSQNLDIKIGDYTKEWGINEINPHKKKFTLYFNKNLIIFDDKQHIQYVVAHELTHIFHRDHGKEFNQTLEKLFPQKHDSEDFFERRIVTVFSPLTQNYTWFYILIGLVLTLLLVQLFNTFILWLGQFFFGLNNNSVQF